MSASVETQIADSGLDVVRLAGATRWETAARLADFAFANLDYTGDVITIARGDDFPDALAAGPLAGSLRSPILLAGSPTDLGSATSGWLNDVCLPIEVIRAVGGIAAISQDALGAAVETVEQCHDTWGTLPDASVDRLNHSAVWSGERMLVWGGSEGADHLADCFADQAAYDPVTGTWRELADSPLDGRCGPATVWTGDELIIWGGRPGGPLAPPFDDGAAYDPETDSWRMLASPPIDGRGGPVAAWTGTEMIIVGGTDDAVEPQVDAAAYDPAADTWRAAADFPLDPRFAAASAWTGDELIVVGGRVAGTGESLSDGAAYDPAADDWRELGEALPGDHSAPTAVWSGDALYVVGGHREDPDGPDAVVYDPVADALGAVGGPARRRAREPHRRVVWFRGLGVGRSGRRGLPCGGGDLAARMSDTVPGRGVRPMWCQLRRPRGVPVLGSSRGAGQSPRACWATASRRSR